MTPCPSPLEIDTNNNTIFDDNLDDIFTPPEDPHNSRPCTPSLDTAMLTPGKQAYQDHISGHDTLGNDACGYPPGDVPNICISADAGTADKQTTEMETDSLSVPLDQNKEAAGDVLCDAQIHDHVTAGDTSRTADATGLAKDRDVVNKTTEIKQETQNKEADGVALRDVPNLQTSASAGTSDHMVFYAICISINLFYVAICTLDRPCGPTGNDTTNEQLAPHTYLYFAIYCSQCLQLVYILKNPFRNKLSMVKYQLLIAEGAQAPQGLLMFRKHKLLKQRKPKSLRLLRKRRRSS
ncbi:hypothetical protein C2845_PM12G06360 [Panicum miliaceum]|uniref:Uncharacterized protein n=1 Tax=Panicum miliaceum TaxID=4540 RepID=A0A3L6QIF2_PANMI|nr:hypothetical protein C2845_PM12G06360 [Panicum miliaceum]